MIDAKTGPGHKTFGICFAIAAIMCFFIGTCMFWFQYRVKSWPVVDGRVLKTRIYESHSSGTGSSTGRPIPMYSARVEYVYLVNGVEYTNDRIWLMSYTTSDEDEVKNSLKEFSKGQIVEIRYNSSSPENSCLKYEVSWLTAIPFLIGAVFLIPSSIMFYLAFRR